MHRGSDATQRRVRLLQTPRALRIERAAEAQDWHALLLLLARAPEDVIAGGGIGKAWIATRRQHFEIREIDYAEVLRERAGGKGADGRAGHIGAMDAAGS